jgi:AcrR family transcriptional regulator
MQEKKALSTYKLSLKDEIVVTAMNAFARHGIRAVKMDDIAKQLGISKRTLYEIYDTKEKLLFEGIQTFKQQRDRQFKEMAAKSPNVIDFILAFYRQKTDEMHHTNVAFYVDMMKYPEVMQSLEHVREENRQVFCQLMERGVKEGFFRSDINYKLVFHVFEALGEYLNKHELYQQYSFEEMFHNMIFITLRGFCTRKGIEELDRKLKNL